MVGTPVNANASTNNLAGGALSNNEQNKSESVIQLNNSRTTNVVKAAGEIRRLTASVLVNQGTDPRTDTSMTQLTNIVKTLLVCTLGWRLFARMILCGRNAV